MEKRTAYGTMLLLLLICVLAQPFIIERVRTEPSEPPVVEWSQTYGGANYEYGCAVVETSDGGYAIIGTAGSSPGNFDAWLVKTDTTGTMEWNKTFGGTEHEYGCAVVETSDGGYAIVARTNSFGVGHYDIWLVKTDSTGNMQWNETYGGWHMDWGLSILETDDGGYVIAGVTSSFSPIPLARSDVYLVKTDANGTMDWNKTLGSPQIGEMGLAVAQTSDGGYAIVGHREYSLGPGPETDKDVYLVKTDAVGNMLWNQTYGYVGVSHERGWSVVQTSDGGYIIGGHTDAYGAGGDDYWLIKTDLAGNMLWNQTYGGAGDEQAMSMVQTSDGGYILVGYTESVSPGNSDFWLVKTDSVGNMLWNETFGGTELEYALSVIQTLDGGYAIAGGTYSFGAGDSDLWLIKLASEAVSAEIDIDPDTLNLKSNGQWITACATLPEGYSVGDVDVASVELMHNDVVVEKAEWGEVQDDVLMVKFDRATLRDHLGEVDVDDGDKFYDITLTVTGNVAGTPFEGSDTITVKRR